MLQGHETLTDVQIDWVLSIEVEGDVMNQRVCATPAYIQMQECVTSMLAKQNSSVAEYVQ